MARRRTAAQPHGTFCLALALLNPSKTRFASWIGLAVVTVSACASVGWEEQRGTPVPMSYADNVRANEHFLESLTARRHERTTPEPIVTPLLQRQLRTIAELLQSGQLSVAGAQRETAKWGRDAYHREVEAWVLDCGHGLNMPLPSELVSPPTAVISYASAYHRPPNETSPQCAMLVVIANGPVVEKTTAPK